MKNTSLLVCFWMISSLAFGQYIGVKYPSEKEIDCSFVKLFDFDGNLVLQLEDKEMPFLSSFLMKHYMVEGQEWVTTYGDRWITRNESFFVTEPNQKVLPLSTEHMTYLKNFKGEIVKSFGKKYSMLSQPQNGILIGYRPIEGEYGAFMLTYINEEGEELFEGKEFWEATPFSDGHAIVQETKESDWKVINRDGEEVTNLSEKFELEIVEVHPFVNGYANISVLKKREELKKIMAELKANGNFHEYSDGLLYNSSDNESRLINVLYRVNIKGESHEMGTNTSILNDIYYRKHGPKENFMELIDKGGSFKDVVVKDSVLSAEGKYYLVHGPDGQNRVLGQSGKEVEFPERYKPIKCIQEYILGKRRNQYVLFEPSTRSTLFFEDQTPLHFGDMVVESKEPLEEFIVVNNRLIKIGSTGLSALLDVNGAVLYDFDASQADASLTTELIELSEVFECPDAIDFKELKTKVRSHLHIQCSTVDLLAISRLPKLKTLILNGVNTIEYPETLNYLLQQGTRISISGAISKDDLKVNMKKLKSEMLYINDEEVKAE